MERDPIEGGELEETDDPVADLIAVGEVFRRLVRERPEDVQSFVDETLGDASVNLCYPVEQAAAFAETPPGLAPPPRVVAA